MLVSINIQLIIIIGYFLLLVGLGFFTRKYSRNSTDFLIAGRNLGIVLCTAAIAGEWVGGMSTVGTAEKAYSSGFFPIWYNISTAIGMVIFGFTLASVYRKNNVHTVGEMLEKIFNRKTRIITSLSFAAAFVILGYTQFQTLGSMAAQVLHIEYNTAIIVSGILITIYVYFGGMHSIALTNFMQFILLYVTLITVFILVLIKTGGYSGLFIKLAEVLPSDQVSHFKNPISLGYGPMISWLIGGILAGFASQASIQPVFAARDIRTAKKSAILSAFFIAPIGIIVTTLAIAVRTGIFGGQPPTSQETLPYLLMNTHFLPPWLSGLAMAGIISAIVSTIAPVMFAVSTIMTRDIYQLVFKKEAEDHQIIKVSRNFVVLTGFISIPLAIFFKGSLLDTAYITYAIRASAAIAILMGIYHVRGFIPKPTPQAVSIAMVAAAISSIVFVVFKNEITQLVGFAIDKVYAAIFFTVVSILIVTWFTKPSEPLE